MTLNPVQQNFWDQAQRAVADLNSTLAILAKDGILVDARFTVTSVGGTEYEYCGMPHVAGGTLLPVCVVELSETKPDRLRGNEQVAGMSLESRAEDMAHRAHAGQVRKYTGVPYVEHCAEVANIVRTVPHTEEMLAAAWLHDTLEDTDLDFRAIAELSLDVLRMVRFLTDASKPEDGNRAARKAIDRDHIAGAWSSAKTVKLADLISNTSSIVDHDPGFAKVYLREKLALLEVLKDGDPTLWKTAHQLAIDGLEKINQPKET